MARKERVGFTVTGDVSTGRTFVITGDIDKCVAKAESELQKKISDKKRDFLRWQFEKSEREYANYEKRILTLRSFITTAKGYVGIEGEQNAE